MSAAENSIAAETLHSFQSTPSANPVNIRSRFTSMVKKILRFLSSRGETIFIYGLTTILIVLTAWGSLERITTGLLNSSHGWAVSIGHVLQHIVIPSSVTGVVSRHLTLWVGFVGAVLATTAGRHLGLATTQFLSKGKLRYVLEAYSNLVFFVVLLMLTYVSVKSVFIDAQCTWDSSEAVRLHRLLPWGLPTCNPNGSQILDHIPSSYSHLIVPVAFALMAIRSVWHFFTNTHASWNQKVRPWAIGIACLLVALVMYISFYVDFYPQKTFPAVLQRMFDFLNAKTNGYDRGAVTRMVGLVILATAFLAGTPIFGVIAGLSLVLAFYEQSPGADLAQDATSLASAPTLPIIPLLILAGYFLTAGNASKRIIRFYKSIFGWMPGGVAIMTIVLCTLFTTITGASGVTILALGSLFYHILVEEKYPKGFSLALVTVSGSLGMLFPPSLPVFLYSLQTSLPGAKASVSSAELYTAGVVPGVLLVFLICIYSVVIAIRTKVTRQPFYIKEVFASAWEAKWEIFAPILVGWLFYNGLATPVEAAAVASLYLLLVGLIIKRDIDPVRTLPSVLTKSSTLIGAILILLCISKGLTTVLTSMEVPVKLIAWAQNEFKRSPWLFLLALNGILLVLGSVLEIYSSLFVLVPLIAPLAVGFVHPAHMGIIFLVNLELGLLLPPVGLNLLLSAQNFQYPLPRIYKQILPFLFIIAAYIVLVTYYDGLTVGVLKWAEKWQPLNKLYKGWVEIKHWVTHWFH